MKVYCVIHGYDYEGESLLNVFSTLRGAEKFVKTQINDNFCQNGEYYWYGDSESYLIQEEEVLE